ncbi:MAG: OB-fold nucleic acid binding domain-containing protein [Nanoarchaeota archaeon]|nr:OB-fold nucleic acid binding domain-containing protein [Nanoarchaeota archaeon]
MVTLNYQEIIEKICKDKGVPQEEVEAKIKEKLNQLSDLISKEGAAHIVANEYGVKVYETQTGPKKVKVSELNPMMKNVELDIKVATVYEIRSFKTAVREGKVCNLFVADDTASCRLVIWDEKLIKEVEDGKIKEGDILKVSNGYVKQNDRGYKEVHLGGQSTWIINPKGITIDAVSVSGGGSGPKSERKFLKDLKENDVAAVIGTVVQIFEPRFYDSCPDCGKKVLTEGDGFICGQHGKVESKPQGILNIVFDDGTDNMRIVCFRDNITKVLGLEVIEVKDNPDKFREVQRSVAGKQLKIQGRINRNTFFDRLEMMAFSVEDADPKELAMELQE